LPLLLPSLPRRGWGWFSPPYQVGGSSPLLTKEGFISFPRASVGMQWATRQRCGKGTLARPDGIPEKKEELGGWLSPPYQGGVGGG